MAIPNSVSLYHKIKAGSEGGQEFARLVNLLLVAESRDHKIHFQTFSDAQGDFKGVDALEYGDDDFKDFVTGYQFKFYPAQLTGNQKSSILDSLHKAMIAFPDMARWILVTPEDFMLSQMKWFDENIKRHERIEAVTINGLTRFCGLSIEHWGHTRIIELLLRHQHIGRSYYPELYKDAEGQLLLSKIAIDSIRTIWLQSEYSEVVHYHGHLKNSLNSNPVFDVQIINNTLNLYLLESITVIVENICSTLKGFPPDSLLKSLGTVVLKIDYEVGSNAHYLEDPLILNPKSPLRFYLELADFIEKVNGNWITLKFIFNLSDDKCLYSKSYTFNI